MDSTLSTGLRGLSRWPTLPSLTSGVSGRQRLSAEDWSEVAALPVLASVSRYGDPEAYAHEAAMSELPGGRDPRILGDPPAMEALPVIASRLPGPPTVGVGPALRRLPRPLRRRLPHRRDHPRPDTAKGPVPRKAPAPLVRLTRP